MEIKLYEIPDGLIKSFQEAIGIAWEKRHAEIMIDKIRDLFREAEDDEVLILQSKDGTVKRSCKLSSNVAFRIAKNIGIAKEYIKEELGELTVSINDSDLKDFINAAIPGDDDE